jgi:hypothetical protein
MHYLLRTALLEAGDIEGYQRAASGLLGRPDGGNAYSVAWYCVSWVAVAVEVLRREAERLISSRR